jgi:hypothetical protein
MMPAPSYDEVKDMVARLKALKPKVQPYSMFGDDNHAAIEAEIETLQEELDDDEIADRFGGDRYALSSAEEARCWLDGERGEEDGPLDEVGR